MNLHHRLEKLEAASQIAAQDQLVIFRTIIGAINGKPVQLPVVGWNIKGLGDVLRLVEESDDELQARATEMALKATEKGDVAHLTQITDANSKAASELKTDGPSAPPMSAQEAYILMLDG